MDRLIDFATSRIALVVYGASLTLAFSPFDLPVFAVIAPAFLCFSWIECRSPAVALRNGYLFGLGMFGTGVNWLHISINLFGGVNLPGSLAITMLLILFLALYPAITGYLGKRYFSRSPAVFLFIAIPAIWILAEWCRSWILTGFPWLNLGYSHIDTPLNGLAPILGVYGVGLCSIFTSVLLVALFWYKKIKRLLILAVTVFLWGSTWLLATVNWTSESRSDYQVALLQGAVPQEIKWHPDMLEPSLKLYQQLSDPHWQKDLIIWPETAIPSFFHRQIDFIESLQDKALSTHTDVISGIVEYDGNTGKYYNSMLLINEGITSYYKKHLVPFGEYMPIKSILGPLLNFLEIPMSDFSAGSTSDKPLLFGTSATFGASICYEDAFGEEVISALPEADVLVNITNDAWFGDSIAPHQHLQMARMRALESGRFLLRATNTGISAIIDEKGRIVASSKQFEPNSLSSSVSLFTGLTPYARFGNSPVIVLLLMTLAGLIFNERRKNSNKTKEEDRSQESGVRSQNKDNIYS